MKIKDIIIEGAVVQGNFPKQQAVPLRIGSKPLIVLEDAGIHFFDKPDDFKNLENNQGKYKPISEIIFKKVQKELKKNGFDLETLTSKEVFGYDPTGPLQRVKKMPTQKVCVITFDSGARYLVDTTGANTYIRDWALIK